MWNMCTPGTNRLFPVYSLYLKDGDRFLMCSKKRPNNKTSNYLISMGEGTHARSPVTLCPSFAHAPSSPPASRRFAAVLCLVAWQAT